MDQKTCRLSFGDLAYIEHLPQHTPDGQLKQLKEQHTLIAVHGWLDNAASFIPLMKVMREQHWIAVDLPGHGHSNHKPLGAYYHFIDYVSDLIEFIDQLNLTNPPILIGHSLGGLVSTVLAGLFPDRLTKLVLIDAAGLYTQDDNSVVHDMREGLESRIGLLNKQIKQPTSLAAAIKARQIAGELNYESARLLVERNTKVDSTTQKVIWRTDNRLRLKSPLRIDEHAAAEIIKKITVPVSIILGSEGYTSVKTNLAKYQQCYSNLTTATVTGNHHCHLENPLETAAQIKNFLL